MFFLSDAFAQKKPNILVIFGDDVGYWNVNAYNHAMTGYKTPNFDVWEEPFWTLRVPKLVDLRADPFERGPEEGIDYSHWRIERVFLLVPAQAFVGQWLQSFREFPPRQKRASFNLEQVIQKLSTGAANANN
jgi:hypothetical protein